MLFKVCVLNFFCYYCLICVCLFVLIVIEGEVIDKVLVVIFGSGVKFEEGLGIIEEDVFVLIEEIGE